MKSNFIQLITVLLISCSLQSQSVSLTINSVLGNTVNVTPSITAGGQDIFLANFDIRFQISGNTNSITSLELVEGSILSSTTMAGVIVEPSTFHSGQNLTFNFTPNSFGTQTTFNSVIARIPAASTVGLGNFNIIFSGIPNGNIICGASQNIFSFSNVSPWSQSNVSTSCSVNQEILLPITLTTFSAKKYSDRASKLDWITASEINSDYFEIERSSDGDVWESIGKIAAAGNSQQELNYSFIDDQLAMTRSNNNMFYYRLKLADLDGTFKYSDVKGVNFSNEYTGIIRIYPNPTAEQINVDLGGTEQSDLEKTDISVYDMKGQMLLYRKVSGFGIELIETQNLPASTYNVVVKQGDKIHQQRVIKID